LLLDLESASPMIFHRSARRGRAALRRTAVRWSLEALEPRALLSGVFWQGFAGNPQHTATSSVPSLPITVIRWQSPVDAQPQYSGTDLLAHYGSPLVTDAGTVIIPVKTGASGGFEVQSRQVIDGTLNWRLSTDYILPSHGWLPSLQPTLTPADQLDIPAAGGTILQVANADSASAPTPTRIAFYGIDKYTGAAQDGSIFINTPITSDAAGNLYFGFLAAAGNSLGLQSGIARIDASGQGSWVTAATVSGDSAISQVPTNSAPALSADGRTLYVPVSTGDSGRGYLLALDSRTLGLQARAALKDPSTGNDATLSNDGTASPMVAPDGDVYFGVLDNPFGANHGRGWLLHFSGDLGTLKAPGGFGWDDTPSLVPASMVPSYHGAASYLLMVKYNNYAQVGGDGINKLALLDPTQTVHDPVTGVDWMSPTLEIAGPTPDPEFSPTHPGAVREWCINTAVVDPATDSILANSEDGSLYRWDLASNTLSQKIVLTPGLGEAYTPTIIAGDGTVLAINNATLFAVGKLSTHNPPRAVDDSYLAVKETTLTIPAATGVLANDQDIDGNPLTAQLVSQPAHGSLTLNADGSFSYTPSAGYVGADAFQYKDWDGFLTGNTATVSLTVVKIYVPPTAADDSYSTNMGEGLVVPAPGLLANDFSPEGTALTPVLVRPPSNGSLQLLGGGGFLYAPNPAFRGVDSFQYRVTDGVSQSNPATVQIRVIDNSAPPIVTAMPVQATQGALFQGVLVGTLLVGDPSQASKTYTAVVNWGDGTPVSTATVTAVDSQLSNITASHVYDRPGSFSFTLTVKKGFDGAQGSVSALGTAVVSPLATGLSGSLVLAPGVTRGADGTPIVNTSVQTIVGSAPPGWQVQAIAWPRGIVGTAIAGANGQFQMSVGLPDGTLTPSLLAVNPPAQAAGSQLVLSLPLGTLTVDTTPPVVQAVRLVSRSGRILVTFRDNGSGFDPSSLLAAGSYSVQQARRRSWAAAAITSVLDLGATAGQGSRTVALVVAGGRRLSASRYLLRISGQAIRDWAGNLLDGRLTRKLPSGNGHPGTDFVGILDSRGRLSPPGPAIPR
jgi:hypothetical protein